MRIGFSPRQLETFEAIATTLIPTGGAFALGAAGRDIPQRLGAFLHDISPWVTFGFGLLLTAFEWLAVLATGRPFSKLPADRRARLMAAWEGSRLYLRRNVFHSLKLLVTLVFYSDPDVEKALGYTPQCPPEKLGRAKRMQVREAAQAAEDLFLEADAVVVGSGAGGAVVAAELAESGLKVIVVEEGNYYSGIDFTQRPWDSFRQLYRNGGLTGTFGTPNIIIPLGRAVGGTTIINSGSCFRAPDAVIEQWQRHSGLDLSTAEYAELCTRVEQRTNVKPVPANLLGRNSELFAGGAAALGWAGGPIPRNESGCVGSGVCAFGCPSDAKQSMNLSYLPRAVAAGAEIVTQVRVVKILREGSRAVGVSGDILDHAGNPTGRQATIRARHVVIACGALLTPVLLQRNGLFDRGAWVGRNLHIHPAMRVAALFEEPVNGWIGVPQSYNINEFTHEGIFIQGQFIPPSVEAPALPGFGLAHKELMAKYAHLGSFGALISDTSSGRVRPGPGGMRISYSMNETDRRRMLRAVSLTSQIFFAAGATTVFPQIRGQEILRSAEAARAIEASSAQPVDMEMMAFHPQGTCRMGASPNDSVTDAWGRFHGMPGLYVADASLMPTSVKVNPQITIMALATRVSRGIIAGDSAARVTV